MFAIWAPNHHGDGHVALWRTLGFAEDDALRALLPMLSGTIETARDVLATAAEKGRYQVLSDKAAAACNKRLRHGD